MKKITIYSGDPCPYCNAAKALLKTKDVEIEEFDIWKDPAKAKEMLQKGLDSGKVRFLLEITTLVVTINFKKLIVMVSWIVPTLNFINIL